MEGIGNEELERREEIDEINAGTCDSLTYKQIEEKYPEEYKKRQEDKLNYRYPKGESYIDLMNRLQPFIAEIEASPTPVIVVSHQATLRCLYSHFKSLKWEEIPFVKVPLHSLVKFEPGFLGYRKTIYKFDIEKECYSTTVSTVNFAHDFAERMTCKI